MRRPSFGLAFSLGWAVAYGLLVVIGSYPSPLWGGEGALSGLFAALCVLPGFAAASLSPRRLQRRLLSAGIAGAIVGALLTPLARLVSASLDIVGSSGFLPWVLLFTVIQAGLSIAAICLVNAMLPLWARLRRSVQ